jgi:iron complex transport system substrate-binding protein
MNRKMLLALVIIVALLVPVSACAPSAPAVQAEPPVQEEAAEPVVEEPAEVVEEKPAEEIAPAEVVQLVDGFGREVELEVPVSRIVSIAPSNVEVLFAIGAGDLVVGRDDTADFPEEALAVESIGGTWGELNTEAIVALEPDLVLGADLTSPEQIAQLEALDIPVFILGNPVDFDGLYDNLRTAGVITGHMDDAEALISALQERVAAVDEKVSGVETVSVFYEVDGTDPSAPWTVGAGTFHDYVITMAGGENIAAGLEYYSTLSAEAIVTADPDVIVFGEGPWVPVTVESLGERPGWGTLSAVVNNRVYGIETNWFDRPGPRLVDAYEALAAYLHPEAFE